jgi:hypothetical protein
MDNPRDTGNIGHMRIVLVLCHVTYIACVSRIVLVLCHVTYIACVSRIVLRTKTILETQAI